MTGEAARLRERFIAVLAVKLFLSVYEGVLVKVCFLGELLATLSTLKNLLLL